MEKHFSARKTDEASMTGGGASFTTGAGMGHFGNTAKKK